MTKENPCLQCGACCAHYRVSFYCSEADKDMGGLVPVEMTEDVSPVLRCMRGTNCAQPRCIALQGEIGRAVRCLIYAFRPSPCREFGLSYETDGWHAEEGELERCNAARAAWGLQPLSAAE